MREKMEDVLNALPSCGAVEAMARKSERADVLVNMLDGFVGYALRM